MVEAVRLHQPRSGQLGGGILPGITERLEELQRLPAKLLRQWKLGVDEREELAGGTTFSISAGRDITAPILQGDRSRQDVVMAGRDSEISDIRAKIEQESRTKPSALRS